MGRYDSTPNDPSNRKIIIYVCLTLLLLGLLSYFFFETILQDDEMEKEQLARPLIIPDKAVSGEVVSTDGEGKIPRSESPNPNDMPLQMPDDIIDDPRDKPYLDGLDDSDQDDDFTQNQNSGTVAFIKKQYPSPKSRDDAVRKEVKEISPKLMQWMKSDNLINKFMVIANDFSQGIRSYDHLSFLGRNKPFSAVMDSKGYYLDPKSYQRFDSLVEAFSALNVREAMQVYQQFKPLLQDAYDEFGYPKGYEIEDVLNKAIAKILDTPIILDRIPLVRRTTIYYKYADANIEKLDPVQKQFIRMGPENTKKVQIKLRQFASAIADIAE